jgi:hypothetical protein
MLFFNLFFFNIRDLNHGKVFWSFPRASKYGKMKSQSFCSCFWSFSCFVQPALFLHFDRRRPLLSAHRAAIPPPTSGHGASAHCVSHYRRPYSSVIDGPIVQFGQKRGKRKRETKFKVSFSSSFLISSFFFFAILEIDHIASPYAMLDN